MITQEKPQESKKRKGAPLWLLILLIFIMVAVGIGLGYSDIKSGKYNSTIITVLGPVPVSAPLQYDSAPKLIPLLPSESTGGPYSFYLGSGVGFPPMGLKLDMYGVLKGTPTGTGDSKFQICVKDVGGRSACRMFSMTVVPKTTASKPTYTNSTGGGGQNTNVVQGTVRSEKWEGTYTNREVEDYGAGVCTTDTSAPISICMTWKGQNFEGPVDFPEGFKDTLTKNDPSDICAPTPPHCGFEEGGCLASCGYIRGYIDPSGNLKVSFLRLAEDIMSLMHDPNYNPITSEIMVGNSMTVEYSSVTHYSGSQSNKGSFTATKVSDSCK